MNAWVLHGHTLKKIWVFCAFLLFRLLSKQTFSSPCGLSQGFSEFMDVESTSSLVKGQRQEREKIGSKGPSLICDIWRKVSCLPERASYSPAWISFLSSQPHLKSDSLKCTLKRSSKVIRDDNWSRYFLISLLGRWWIWGSNYCIGSSGAFVLKLCVVSTTQFILQMGVGWGGGNTVEEIRRGLDIPTLLKSTMLFFF